MATEHQVETYRKGKTVTLPSLLDKDGGDRNFRQFLHNLFAFSSRLEAIRSEFGKQLGLTGIEYTCLIATAYLCENDTVYVNRLADHLHLSGAFITSQTNKLAKKGFLTKKKDSVDARRVQLEITAQGYEALSSLSPIQQQVNDVLFAGLDHDTFTSMAAAIKKLISNGDRAVTLAGYLSQSKIE